MRRTHEKMLEVALIHSRQSAFVGVPRPRSRERRFRVTHSDSTAAQPAGPPATRKMNLRRSCSQREPGCLHLLSGRAPPVQDSQGRLPRQVVGPQKPVRRPRNPARRTTRFRRPAAIHGGALPAGDARLAVRKDSRRARLRETESVEKFGKIDCFLEPCDQATHARLVVGVERQSGSSAGNRDGEEAWEDRLLLPALNPA